MSKKNPNKKGPKFNIFDLLIILAILSCVSAIVVRVFFIDEVTEDMKSATVQFTIEGVSEMTANAFCVPERSIYLQSDNSEIGTLVKASYSAQKLFAEDAGGKLVEVLHPVKKEVQGVAKMDGFWSEDGFLIGGTYLATVGSTLDIYTKDVACTITIVSVSETQ